MPRHIKYILRGFLFLHNKGYVHRDLRWSNIIKDEDGNFRIIDLEHSWLEGDAGYRLSCWPIELEGELFLKKINLLTLYQMAFEYYFCWRKDGEARSFMEKLRQGLPVQELLQEPWLIDIDLF